MSSSTTEAQLTTFIWLNTYTTVRLLCHCTVQLCKTKEETAETKMESHEDCLLEVFRFDTMQIDSVSSTNLRYLLFSI